MMMMSHTVSVIGRMFHPGKCASSHFHRGVDLYAGGALHCLIVAGHTGSETVDDVGQNSLLLVGRTYSNSRSIVSLINSFTKLILE